MLRTIRKIGAWILVIITIVLIVIASSADASLSLIIIIPVMLGLLFSWGIGMIILEKIFS